MARGRVEEHSRAIEPFQPPFNRATVKRVAETRLDGAAADAENLPGHEEVQRNDNTQHAETEGDLSFAFESDLQNKDDVFPSLEVVDVGSTVAPKPVNSDGKPTSRKLNSPAPLESSPRVNHSEPEGVHTDSDPGLGTKTPKPKKRVRRKPPKSVKAGKGNEGDKREGVGCSSRVTNGLDTQPVHLERTQTPGGSEDRPNEAVTTDHEGKPQGGNTSPDSESKLCNHVKAVDEKSVTCQSTGENGVGETTAAGKSPNARVVMHVADGRPRGTMLTRGTANDTSITVVNDTGAQVTCMSENCFKRIRLLKPLQRPSLEITAAEGTRIECIGVISIPFKFGSIAFRWPTYIVRGLQNDCIFGTDVLAHLNAEICCATGTIKYKNKAVQMGADMSADGRRAVRLVGKSKLRARQMGAIEATIEVRAEDRMDGTEWIVEPTKAPGGSRVWIARTLVRADAEGHVFVCALNNLPRRMLVGQGVVGWAYPVAKPTVVANLEVAKSEAKPPGASQDCKDSVRSAKFRELLSARLDESPDLSAEQRGTLIELLSRHIDTLYAKEVGTHDGIKCDIDVQGSRPLKQRSRQLSPKELAAIRQEVDTLLARKIIRPSQSPWANRIVMVAKKDGSTRVCVDFRAVNKMCVTDAYPTPLISQTVDQVNGMSWFSNLDAESGYHQIRLTERAKPITAFSTPFGLYEYEKMPFGLKNAGACFQRVMDAALSGLSWQCCMVFVDDIVVFSRTWEEHLQHLDAVLKAVSKAQMTLKLKKCFFGKRELEFLGVIIGKDGVRADPEKVKAVQEFVPPKTIRQLRSFLGMATQLRRFIKGYASIARPLTLLLRDDAKPRWKKMVFTVTEKTAFDDLKLAMTGSEILAYPNFNKPFQIVCDASDYALGAMLAQLDELTKVERPIQYISRVLKGAELNYSATHREALAVVWSLASFRPYIHGVPSVVVTDHSALTWIMSHKEPTARMARWAMQIQEYDLEFIHRKGKENAIADALSRMERLRTEQQQGTADRTVDRAELSEVPVFRVRARRKRKVPLWQPAIDDMQAPELDRWRRAQAAAQWVNDAIQFEKSKTIPDDVDRAKRVVAGEGLFVFDGNLLRRVVVVRHGQRAHTETPLVVPDSLVLEVLQLTHNSMIHGAHSGVHRTMSKLRPRFWWPGMYTDVCKHVAACEACQRHRASRIKKALIGGHPMGASPFDLVACDLMTMPESTVGNKYLLVVTDYYTRFSVAVPIPNKTADTVASAILTKVILVYGPPRRLLTDNGGEFKNELLSAVCRTLQVHKIFTSPYHPQTDGVVERLNQTILHMMAVYVDGNHDKWDELVPFLMYAHNSAITAATGISPFQALFGRPCMSTLELGLEDQAESIKGKTARDVWAEMHENFEDMKVWMQEFQQSVKHAESEYADNKRRRRCCPTPGSVVWVANNRAPINKQKPKLLPKYRGPYVVLRAVGEVAVRLRGLGCSSVRTTMHVDNVKRMLDSKARPVVLTEYSRPTPDKDAKSQTESDDQSRTDPYEVEAVTGHVVSRGIFWLRIKWKGYAEETLVNEIDCECHNAVEAYFDSNRVVRVDPPQ